MKTTRARRFPLSIGLILSILFFVLLNVIGWMVWRSTKPKVETFLDEKVASLLDLMREKADTTAVPPQTSPPAPQPLPPADPEALPAKVREVIAGAHEDRNLGGRNVIGDVLGEEDPENVPDAKIRCVFEPVSNPDAVSSLALTDAVRIHEVKLETIDNRNFLVSLSVENLTKEPITAQIPKGQIFENKKRDKRVQNLASWNLAKVNLPPGQVVDLKVDALCINRNWKRPMNEDGNITVLRIKNDDFQEQGDLWSKIEESIRCYQQRTDE